MKIALVHDDFTQFGGAENLFAEIAKIYPSAPIYASLVNWKKLPPSIDKKRVHTSFMQKIPFATKFYKALLPLYPLAFESFDFSAFDLVISSTTRFAKGIITGPKTIHICYVNSLPRFLHHLRHKKSYLPPLLEFVLKPFIGWLKRWDRVAASRVDFYIANSQNVAHQIEKVYGQKAQVVYPFADTDFFSPAKIHNWKLKSQNYYLVVSRLVRWKKIEIAARAAENLDINLIIVGDGPHKNTLMNLSPRHVEFAGNISKERLRELYQNAKGLIVTQEEDFGIAVVEAQACGIPVIAYNAGGQKETVKNQITGLFFESQTAESLEDAIRAASAVKWDLRQIRKNALKFSKSTFSKSLKAAVNQYVRKQQ